MANPDEPTMNAEHVIRRLSDLKKLSLETARAGLKAGLFKIDLSKSQGPPPAEYVILRIADEQVS